MTFGGSELDKFYEDFKRYLEMDTGEDRDWKNRSDENAYGNGNRKNEEYLDKEEAKHDLSNRQLCTPSYRRLPDNYPRIRMRWRTELGESVLNDRLVSVGSGSEDCRYKLMPKNKYEEILSTCDDERYGLDMVLNGVSSTIEKVEKLLDKIERDEIDTDAKFRIKEHIPDPSLRLIQGIYGKHGLDVAEILHKKPTIAAVLVILTRLNQKKLEWLDCLARFNKVWVAVRAKYHTKSLDYHGFYFKEQDPINLEKEALLAEVKDINKKTQENDERILDSIYGSWEHLIPDIEWEYPDKEVHEDIYKIIEFSSEEISTSEEQNNCIMKIWKEFLEPLLNISRLQVPRVIEEIDRNSSRVGVSVERENLSSPDVGVHSTEIQLSYIQHTAHADLQHEEARSCKHKSASGNNMANNIHDLCFYQGSLAQENSSRDKLSGVSGLRNTNLASLPSQNSYMTRAPFRLLIDLDLEENGTRYSQYHQSLDPSYELEEGEIPPEGYEQKSSMDYEIGMFAKAEGDIGETDNGQNVNKERTSLSLLHPYLNETKPLREYAPKISGYEKYCNSRIFFGNDSFYVLIKLHRVLYQQLLWAKRNSFAAQKKSQSSEDLNSPECYVKFKSTLYNLLGGSMGNLEYEVECFSILGPQSYVLYTLDLLIHEIVKQLQDIASNETDCKFLQLYEYNNSKEIGTVNELAYYKNTLVLQDGRKFRFECASEKPTKLAIHLIDDLSARKVFYASNPEAAAYVNGNSMSSLQDTKEGSVFLKRNKDKLCYGDDDDDMTCSCKASEGINKVNGLECIFSNSSKVGYVMGTEDYIHRTRKKKRSNSAAKTEQQ